MQQLTTTVLPTADAPVYLGEEPYTVSSDTLTENLGDCSFQAVIQDEAGKVNINKATEATLDTLFGDLSIADCILDWHNSATVPPSQEGAGSEYYSTLNPPYNCKHAPFETVQELQLVKGITADTLSSPSAIGTTALGDLLTCYEQTYPTPSGLVDINTATQQSLQTSSLASVLSPQDIRAIVNYNNNRTPRFRSPAEIVLTGISRAKIMQIYDRLTVSGVTPALPTTGLLNINTASMEALAVQTGQTGQLALDTTTAQAIIDYRSSDGVFSSVGGLLGVSTVSNDMFVSVAPYLTVKSNVFKIISTGSSAKSAASATITCIVQVVNGTPTIKYWHE